MAQHLRGSGDGLILLFRCDLALALIGRSINMAAVSDESAKALRADCSDEFLDRLYGWLARKRPDPVLARVDFPEDLNTRRQGLGDTNVVE